MTCLGHGEEVLGDFNDTAEILYVVHTGLDGVGVVLASGVEDVLDFIALTLGPLLVHGASVVVHSPVDGEQREGNN